MQSEHKIQSGKGSLHIEMDQVPKILKPLVSEWTREGYIVSFKVGSLFRNMPSIFAGTRVNADTAEESGHKLITSYLSL